MMVLDEVCAELKNYFTYEGDKHIGDFVIENGVIISPLLDFGSRRLIRIVGSAYNDGVHYSDEVFADEAFHGAVWIMSPPLAFLEACKEYEEWKIKYADVEKSPYSSESFGGYSYSRNDTGKFGVFSSRFNVWRKIR